MSNIPIGGTSPKPRRSRGAMVGALVVIAFAVVGFIGLIVVVTLAVAGVL